MVFDVSVAMTWVLFLALFPIAFFWLRRAWRILFQHDYSEVALKRGLPPANPKKFAPYAGGLNLIAGAIIVGVILGVVGGLLSYETWSAIAGSTIWMKFIFDFILSRHAHPIVPKNRLEPK
jgi:ABC-type phosphate transport system permease subunit